MIIEMRTYTLQPGTLAEAEKRFGEALPHREKHGKIAAFWHTEVGPLNQIIHVWAYDNFEHRNAVRGAAMKEAGWPPKIQEFIVGMKNEVFHPAPFSPPLEPRQLGGIYEIRMYTYAPGTLPAVMERWAEKVPERIKLSPLVGAWHSELGGLNKWCHIWAYKDAAERQRIRGEAISKGIWPPGSPPGALLKQENMLVVPAAFSPLK